VIEKLRNIFAIPELRRKILFTLGILIIVRLGAQVPIPGINSEALRQTMESLNDTFFDEELQN
jgi:preprotein translocase subunit SecY